MTLREAALLPFAALYERITRCRNILFDKGKLRAVGFIPFTVSVGNLSVGGTGKTPHTEYLIRLFSGKRSTAVLSRGYGRRTKGFIFAEPGVTASEIGDEPFQFFWKFAPETAVAVGEQRVLAVPEIMQRRPGLEVLLLDDAYQHRSIKRDLNILLTDISRPFFDDYVLPAGRLREQRKEAARADVLIFTKCPSGLSKARQEALISKANPFLRKNTPVFFTGINYSEPLSVFGEALPLPKSVVSFSGLANDRPFQEFLSKKYDVREHIRFSDHQKYDKKSVLSILKTYDLESSPGELGLVCTEKDAVKFQALKKFESLRSIPFYYIPISVFFISNEEKFQELLLRKAEEKLMNKG